MQRFTKLFLLFVLVGSLLNATPTYADQTHIVQAGETLFSISQTYGVSITAIMQANQLSGTLIYAGQSLTIPDGSAPAPAAPVATTGGTHVVQPGETLFTIGLRYGLVWTAIAQANGISGDGIYSGQVLVIPASNAGAPVNPPAPEAPAPTAVPAVPSGSVTTHIVQAGETLYLIGVKYGIPWVTIQQANGLTSDVVFSGQSLVIPAPGTQVPAPPPAPQVPAVNNANGTVHVVQLGETLYLIGLKYNLPWTAIANANGISGTYIYVGQQLTIPADASGAYVGTPGKTPPGGSGKRFLVDISEQTLYAFDGDTLVRSMLVSTGTAQYPTVLGTYYIQTRLIKTRMRGCCPEYDLQDVPYTQYFYQGYGIHGTYWHNNFGTPMSHGCVNLTIADSEWAFNWATYGTQVTVIR